MTPEQAVFLRDFLLAGIEGEMAITRRVVAAVPDDRRDHRPDPKARTGWELAWHLIVSDAWFLDGVAKGDFSAPEPPMPAGIKTAADMVAWHQATVPPLLARVRSLDGEKLAKEIDFFGVFKFANVCYLNFQLVHAVHHRGFLASYLRPMGSKVPSIYGGSADEPFQMPAQQS